MEEGFPPLINNWSMASWRPVGAHSALYKYTLCSRAMLYWSRLIFHHVKSQFYCNAGGAEYCGLSGTTVDWTGLDNGAVVQHYKRSITFVTNLLPATNANLSVTSDMAVAVTDTATCHTDYSTAHRQLPHTAILQYSLYARSEHLRYHQHHAWYGQ